MFSIAHKLQLFVLKSVQNVPFLSQVDNFLIVVYKFSGSFYKRQDELSAKMLKIQHVHSV